VLVINGWVNARTEHVLQEKWHGTIFEIIYIYDAGLAIVSMLMLVLNVN
jgi:hypothetical protein